MKVGIITHYYKSINYGGNLQAYALCEVIKKLGKCDVEQICYDSSISSKKTIRSLAGSLYRSVKEKFLPQSQRVVLNLLEERKKKILKFNATIPHSADVYSNHTIKNCVRDYDVFVTGSDQVWNPEAYNEAYLLSFVDGTFKKKFSYAASLSVDFLSEGQRKVFYDNLADYSGITVREGKSIQLLSSLTNVPVDIALDPTLLLERSDWERMCTPRAIKEKYIFAFFLGNLRTVRKQAKDFAAQMGLKLVTVPYALGYYRECDEQFGDIPLYDVDPFDFISLIKNAEYVFTDSFHATVFSLIFEKQFLAFQRSDIDKMSSRITNLLALFEEDGRYIKENEQTEAIKRKALDRVLYETKNYSMFESRKKDSLSYIKHMII